MSESTCPRCGGSGMPEHEPECYCDRWCPECSGIGVVFSDSQAEDEEDNEDHPLLCREHGNPPVHPDAQFCRSAWIDTGFCTFSRNPATPIQHTEGDT